MKKIIIILSLMILLTPLFARGAAEGLSESGVHGLFSVIRETAGLPSLDKEEETADEEDRLLLTGHFSSHGYESDIEGYSDHARISLPEGLKESDVGFIMKKALSELGASDFVSFEISSGTLVFYYPEQTEDSLKALYEALASYLKTLIDSLTPHGEPEVAVAETVAVEESVTTPLVEVAETESEGVVADDGAEKPYRVSFSYRGIKTDIEGYLSYTNVYIPLGVTKNDVQGVVSFMLEKDPSFLLRSFRIDGAKVVFTYSEQSAETIIETVDSLEEYLKAYIDSIFDTAVTAEKKSEAFEYKFGVDAGIRGKFEYVKGTTHVFPTVTARADMILFSCFFAEANAEIMCYRSDSYLLVVGAAEVLGGLRIGNDSFNFFGFYGARYTVSTKNSGFSGGMEKTYGGGMQIGLGKYADFRLMYEHFNNENYYNVSIGVRF